MVESRSAVQLPSIQVLRAAAALSVLAAHLPALSPDLPRFAAGEAGVDLFFVVSGFVMVIASGQHKSEGPARFLLRRLIRIVPLYWIVTTLYVASSVLTPLPHKAYDVPYILASYLYIPWRSPDGYVEPVVGQGWTLNYEMAFYLLFATTLLLPRRIGLLAAGTALTALVTLGACLELPVPLKFWTSNILLEFAVGIGIGAAFEAQLRLRPVWRVAAVSGGVAAILAIGLTVGQPDWRGVVWGLPAGLIVAGAALGPWPVFIGQRVLLAIGDASYAIYLLHGAVIRLMHAVRDLLPIPLPLTIAVAVGVTIAISLLTHLLFERPMKRMLTRAFLRRPSVPCISAIGSAPAGSRSVAIPS
jgi:exopolysaccharide production protein ExoZ